MWRAAHSVSISVVDIPDTPSPVRTSAKRPMSGRDELKRVASAPELGEVLEIAKLSPPTPTRRTGRGAVITPSPHGRAMAERLQSALTAGETAASDSDVRVRLMTPRTPSRSPRKRVLASPMTSPPALPPSKLQRATKATTRARPEPAAVKRVGSLLPTPPPSSPPLLHPSRKPLSPRNPPAQAHGKTPRSLHLVRKCFGKALSLRSRLKLAAFNGAKPSQE